MANMSKAETPLHICMFADERSIHTRRWVRGLREMRHRVDLITLIKDKDNDVGGMSLNATGKWSYLTKIGMLRSLVRGLNPDILHTHYASSFGFLASFIKHPRKILSVWGNDVIVFPYSNMLFKMMVRRSLKKSHYITATSNFLKRSVKKLDSNIERTRVIPFGIDTAQFDYCRRSSRSKMRIGIAKSLWPKYGVDVLIRAFYILSKSHDNIELLIAGKGEFESKYKQLVKDLQLGDRVRFLGFINHDELPEFLYEIDIFAMPSVSDGESFGVAALEASSTGLPVVATRVGGVPEVVMDNKTGLLVERRDIEGLAGAIEKLILNPDLREKMGRAGRAFVESDYRWESNLKAMSDLYMEVTGQIAVNRTRSAENNYENMVS